MLVRDFDTPKLREMEHFVERLALSGSWVAFAMDETLARINPG